MNDENEHRAYLYRRDSEEDGATVTSPNPYLVARVVSGWLESLNPGPEYRTDSEDVRLWVLADTDRDRGLLGLGMTNSEWPEFNPELIDPDEVTTGPDLTGGAGREEDYKDRVEAMLDALYGKRSRPRMEPSAPNAEQAADAAVRRTEHRLRVQCVRQINFIDTALNLPGSAEDRRTLLRQREWCVTTLADLCRSPWDRS